MGWGGGLVLVLGIRIFGEDKHKAPTSSLLHPLSLQHH